MTGSLLQVPVPEGTNQAPRLAGSLWGPRSIVSTSQMSMPRLRGRYLHPAQQCVVGSLRGSYLVEIQGPVRCGSRTIVTGKPLGPGC